VGPSAFSADGITAITIASETPEPQDRFSGVLQACTLVCVEELMLIFDSFPSGEAAKKFAAHVKEKFDRESSIAWSIESSNARLVSPIVLVLGTDEYSREQKTVASVKQFGGQFVGVVADASSSRKTVPC
jgi:hypothetical protein